jgi:hypothetical protein
MKFIDGYKTYIAAVGLILVGIGSMLSHKLGYTEGLTDIAQGLVVLGARNFGQKILDNIPK